MHGDQRSVSILGCGWFGWPLAQRLKSSGWRVCGSKTSDAGVAELTNSGINGFILHLNPEPAQPVAPELLGNEVAVINMPPSRSAESGFYLKQNHVLGSLLASGDIRKLIFISSTSVYPNANRAVRESDRLTADKPVGKELQQVETYWRTLPDFEVTIIRFGGLVGPGRDPGRFLAGKKGLSNGDAPVNLIHLDDCIAITETVLDQNAWGRTFNACSPGHPSRRRFYEKAAAAAGLEPPQFLDEPTVSFKQVACDLLQEQLGYRFIHPDPLRFPGIA